MNRQRRRIATMMVFIPIVICVTGMWMWSVARNDLLNQKLILAVNKDDAAAASIAVALGANPNAQDETGRSAWERICKHLWQPLGDYPTYSALDTAVMFRPVDNPDLVKLLVEHGAHCTGNFSPLFHALFLRKPKTAKMLIEYDPKMARDLLSCSISTGNDHSIIELMLRNGSDPDLADEQGITPLGNALLLNDIKSVQLLLRYHADARRATKGLPGGTTLPLEYAEKHQMVYIAKLLRMPVMVR